jgi:RNA polymerase sigma-70 factor, ECF subfamily
MTATFTHLLAANYTRVHRAALGWLGDEQEAHEVAQEALLRAYRARDRYDPSRPFYPWLRKIVRNACLDARARARHRAVSGLDEARVVSTAPDPAEQVETADAVAHLRTALAALNPEHREILVLRHFEDLSYAEIGEILGVPQGTVMSRLYRARKALAERMEEGR